MGEATSKKHNEERRWRWLGPALVTLSGVIALATPHLHPAIRVAGCVLLLVAAMRCGYYLYANYRETRQHGSKASNSI